MAHEFTTAAYRFGHSMIQGIIRLYATDNSGFTGLVFPKKRTKIFNQIIDLSFYIYKFEFGARFQVMHAAKGPFILLC